jgi:GH15 family glucan-1,4-alpha-glucosidase
MSVPASSGATRPERRDGYLPLREYALIGNKRTAALVASDGAIDWLPVPSFDSAGVFSAVLDPGGGGRMTLAPAQPFEVERRYRPGSCVLETTFRTAGGAVRVTDAMSRPITHAFRFNEIIRRVDGLEGEVAMRWSVEPRFGFGAHLVDPEGRAGHPAFIHGKDALVVQAHDVGDPELGTGHTAGGATISAGDVAALALSAFRHEPLALSSKEQLLSRLEATDETWRRWSDDCSYDGPWREEVLRSALTLELMADVRTGAMVAAPTLGLPEAVGGSRNFDYRYCWLRDANLSLEAMLSLGYDDQVHASLAWMLAATEATSPWLRPMYLLDGSARLPDYTVPLPGYRGSQPVTVGNPAQTQLQLGNYGDMLDTAFKYVSQDNALDPAAGHRLADAVDYVTRVWDHDDASIWELGDQRPYTQSKLACWLTCHRAVQLAQRGDLPDDRIEHWKRTAETIRVYIHDRCWSERKRAYGRSAGSDELDASVLLASRGSFIEDEKERFSSTIDAIRRELGAGGPLVYRYSGMQGEEGAFLACSFWVAEALARVDRRDEGADVMDGLVGLANDVGLYSEEMDPATKEFRGNLPQALTHLALVTAAAAFSPDPARISAVAA